MTCLAAPVTARPLKSSYRGPFGFDIDIQKYASSSVIPGWSEVVFSRTQGASGVGSRPGVA